MNEHQINCQSDKGPILKRRHLIGGATALAATSLALTTFPPKVDYEEAARRQRRPNATTPLVGVERLHELVRHATLAPSSHNTQAWKFRATESQITIAPDFSRRCPVVDPDDHHMFVSLGCAAENLVHAALANGLRANTEFDPSSPDTVSVSLEATKALASPLFHAISRRQCTRGDYDGTAISGVELQLLEHVAKGNGVRVMLLTNKSAIENVLDYVINGNTAQMNDPAFIKELTTWIRFSRNEAVRSGDGLFSGASANPALPEWLGRRMMHLFFTEKSENERYARQIRSSAGIAVFVSDANDKAHWVEAGRCYERFALQATALGIRNAFVNQPVEVGSIRAQLAASLGAGHLRPDLIVRFGRGPTLPFSMRRPVESVLL